MIFIECESDQVFPAHLLERAAGAALEFMEAPDADLTIAVVDDDRIRGLNRDFLGHDAPTDVLSFPAGELDPDTSRRYLGDIVVSLRRAAEQAGDRGHSVEAEMQLLVIHGILHLLGLDHAASAEKKRMWAVQAQILQRLGISPTIVHE